MTNEEHPNLSTPDIEFLGQKVNYPRSWQGVAVVCAISVLIVCVTFIALVKSRPENLKTIGLITGRLDIDRKHGVIKQRKWYRIEFWTPSEKTIEGLRPFLQEYPDRKNNYLWQIHDEEKNNIREKNIEFGMKLIQDSAIAGYRRYEVYGQASSTMKQGWWWVVGVDGEYSVNYIKWFTEMYKQHWEVPENKSCYLEITAFSPRK